MPILELAPGVFARADGLLFITSSRTLVAADLHLGYEECIGAALPLWSIAETARKLKVAIAKTQARELVLLGDIVHGTRMSEGASRCVISLLDHWRTLANVVAVAGNHEGRGRGRELLGHTVESVDRAGWHLTHGDIPGDKPSRLNPRRSIIGHVHPSVRLSPSMSAPAFVYSASLIALPAQTPFSPGLHVASREAQQAFSPWLAYGERARAVIVSRGRLLELGALEDVREAMRTR
jgi:metallophosphoesterase superfamily enzyme